MKKTIRQKRRQRRTRGGAAMDRAKLVLLAATAAALSQPGQSFSVQSVLDYAKSHFKELATATTIDENDPAIVSAAKVYDVLDQKTAAAAADGLGEIVKGLSGTFQSLDMSFTDLSNRLFDLADSIEKGEWKFSTTDIVDPSVAPAAAAVDWTPPPVATPLPSATPSQVDNMYSPLVRNKMYRIVINDEVAEKYPEIDFPSERVFNAVYKGDVKMELEDDTITVWGRRLEDDGFELTLPADAVRIMLTAEDQTKAEKSIQDQIDFIRRAVEETKQAELFGRGRRKTRRKKHPRKRQWTSRRVWQS